MKRAIYSGSFDPITFGHIDLINRGSKIFEELIICVAINSSKKSLFNEQERVDLLKEATKKYDNVKVVHSDKLIVETAKEYKCNTILRGLRAVSDYEYELQMASMNKTLDNDIDTIFLPSRNEYSFLSSSIVKELAAYGGDTTKYVPDYVAKKLRDKYNG